MADYMLFFKKNNYNLLYIINWLSFVFKLKNSEKKCTVLPLTLQPVECFEEKKSNQWNSFSRCQFLLFFVKKEKFTLITFRVFYIEIVSYTLCTHSKPCSTHFVQQSSIRQIFKFTSLSRCKVSHYWTFFRILSQLKQC